MTDPSPTSVKTLIKAAEIGQGAGLNYVYAGNLPGKTGEYEDTLCPHCRTPIIRRYGYVIQEYRLTERGTCPKCGTRIPGVWTDTPETVHLRGHGMPVVVSW
jgi:pyruvate formate lyase activating enzyme